MKNIFLLVFLLLLLSSCSSEEEKQQTEMSVTKLSHEWLTDNNSVTYAFKGSYRVIVNNCEATDFLIDGYLNYYTVDELGCSTYPYKQEYYKIMDNSSVPAGTNEIYSGTVYLNKTYEYECYLFEFEWSAQGIECE